MKTIITLGAISLISLACSTTALAGETELDRKLDDKCSSVSDKATVKTDTAYPLATRESETRAAFMQRIAAEAFSVVEERLDATTYLNKAVGATTGKLLETVTALPTGSL
jgi:hypothetical protein